MTSLDQLAGAIFPFDGYLQVEKGKDTLFLKYSPFS